MLSTKDIDKIEKVVSTIVDSKLKAQQPTKASSPQGNEPEVVLTDPLIAATDAKYEELIKSLPTGNIIVKGRRGAQMINQSAESANLIEEILNKKKHRFTRNNLY